MNNQKKLIVMVITLSLILIISSSYALLRSTKVSQNNYGIKEGILEVTFQDDQTNNLNLTDMYPMSDEDGESQEKTLTFTVENTGTVGTYYDVYIEELSTNPEFKSVIRFISKKDEEGYKKPKTLSENKYIEITGYLEPKQTSTYKVKVWLAEEADNTYMKKEFKAKIVVNAYQESNYAKDIVKSKLVKYEESSKEDFTVGLVAINTNSELYNETENNQMIREYRYSGPTANNYVTFNNENWRILGVFKDENGEELVKIVRNEVLPADAMPDIYEVAERKFQIRYNGEATARWDYDGSKHDNNWNDAGLMQWLNSKGTTNGYLKKLSVDAQNMVTETTYYLGNVYYDNTTVQSYENERKSIKCTSVDSNSHERNCYIWPNNQASWIGKIALIYPSDYGFSFDSKYWSDTKLESGLKNKTEILNTSWFYKDVIHIWYEWFLSPAARYSNDVTGWCMRGSTYDHYPPNNSGVRPTLYLKSDVKITGGTGEHLNPYILSIN